MKCFDANPNLMLNYSCKLKPVREKCSLADISIVTARIPRVFGRFQLFYRYTGGFRPYLLDFTFDACEIMTEKSVLYNNKAALKIINAMKKVYGSLFVTGCPYEGRYDSAKWFDANETISPLLPPIVPAGTFRIVFRFDASPNVTIISFQVDVLFKATKEYRDTDFSLLNMG